MQSFPEWAAYLLLVVVAAAVLVTIFVWRWAVRGPRDGAASEKSMKSVEMSDTVERPMVYAAIGASDVVGTGTGNPDRDNWAKVLHGLMPAGTSLVRLARPGITLREANASEVFASVRAQPDLITIWNCVNDISKQIPLADYRRELEIALARLTDETRAQILVLNVPDLSLLMPAQVAQAQRVLIRSGIRHWNDAITEVVLRYEGRAALLDLFAVSDEMMSRRDYVAADGFHLSPEGHSALARLAWQSLLENFETLKLTASEPSQ